MAPVKTMGDQTSLQDTIGLKMEELHFFLNELMALRPTFSRPHALPLTLFSIHLHTGSCGSLFSNAWYRVNVALS